MQIAIIGTGRMARNLGAGWARAGLSIVFGSRNPQAHADLAESAPGAQVTEPTAALDGADVVVIAIPFPAVEPFAREHADKLRGKVVVDISNPFNHLPDNSVAGAEITARAIGPGARVVAAFKSNFWETLLEPTDPRYDIERDVHYAGDDVEAKKLVGRLIYDLGFRAIDCGPLKNARVLDGMAPLIIELDKRYANGERRSSWRLLSVPHVD
jgi:hypothetical protein